jgi:subtilisin family serine protease
MKSRYAALAITSALVLAACAETPEPTAPSLTRSGTTASIAEGDTYLVRFKGNGVPAGFAANVAALGGEVVFAHAGAGIGAVSGLSGTGAAALAASSGIAAVDLDAYTTVGTPVVATEAADETNSPTAPATAFFFARQWHMRAIKADVAWTAGKLGSSAVKVGILDTGLGYTTPDLTGRVDLANSVSFVPSDNALIAAFFPGAHPIADLHYHGTHVGATVASNAVVGAGVTSNTTLVGIKVCNVNGQCPTSGVLQGILYAADLGLPIANMSLGGTFNRRDASAAGGVGPSFIATINSVFNYANRKGLMLVVSAGNDALDMDHNGNGFVAYCNAPHVVCVSATGPTNNSTNGPWSNIDALASYSNFGSSSVSVAAPGGNGSAVWAACSRFSLQVPVCQTGNFILGLGGTSMASPHVAGLAALLAAEGKSSSQIRSAIQQSADDLGAPGTDPAYGKGRINVAKALGL